MARILGHYHKIYGVAESLEFFYDDQLGSCRVAINSSDVSIDSFTYSSWGVVTQVTGSDNYLASFTGKNYDLTGFIYFNARYYDPTTGRFLTEDPSRKGVNWYAYCENDPVNRNDPTGRQDRSSGYWAVGPWGTTKWVASPSPEEWERSERITSFVLDVIPGVSLLKAGTELVTGRTLLGGEKLSSAEVALNAATLATAGMTKYLSLAGRAAEKALGITMSPAEAMETLSKTVESASIGLSASRVVMGEARGALDAMRGAWQSLNAGAEKWWQANMTAQPAPQRAPGFYSASPSAAPSNPPIMVEPAMPDIAK